MDEQSNEDGDAEMKIMKDKIREQVKTLFADSSIIDQTEDCANFDSSEFQLGRVLGRGGFGTVFEIKSFTLSNKVENDDDRGETRKFMAENCIRNNKDCRYAVKFLSPQIICDKELFSQGMMDMAIETRFLSGLKHPSIIKMRAVAYCDPYNSKYFIVMDRLYDTLDHRLLTWRKKLGMSALKPWKLNRTVSSVMNDKLASAYDLASAIKYMHTKKVIYRDLKPDNIGFDVRDDIKIFDFGLAKELREELKTGDGLYHLTGECGTWRYMAPEVALNKPYNESCDVYSFALLMWEILAMKKPFKKFTHKALEGMVWKGPSCRPEISKKWLPSIQDLLSKCWDASIAKRCDMAQVEEILRCACLGVGPNLSNTKKRRSTFLSSKSMRQLLKEIELEDKGDNDIQ